MKSFITALLVLSALLSQAQTTMKPYTVGHPFNISLPDYMTRTTGINTSASIEFKNTVKDVYGFVIVDDKETLRLAEMSFSGVQEFYEDFIKGFMEGEEKVKKSTAVTKKEGTATFLEADVSYFDKDAKTEIYYLIGVVETPHAFYKVLSYCSLENKAKFREDFRKILYSLRD